MNTRYFCAICNTKPDQISHHKSHLQTQKHREKRESHCRELKYFSAFKTIHPNTWLENDEVKEIILRDCGKELTAENRTDIMIEQMYRIVDKFLPYNPDSIFCRIVHGKPTNVFVDQSILYEEATGNKVNENREAYSEWCIEKILQAKETIKATHKMNTADIRDARRAEHMQRMNLARFCSANYGDLQDIRMNKLDIKYCKDVWSFTERKTYIEKPDFLKDTIVLYACVLFHAFGMMSHDSLIQENSVDEYLYFYKEVEIETIIHMVNVAGYEKKSKMNKKVWVKTLSLNDDSDGFHPECIYVEDEVIKQKFRDYLIKFFTERKEVFLEVIHAEYKPPPGMSTPKDEEDVQIIENWKKKWYVHQANVKADFSEVEKDSEIVSRLLLDSDIFRNVMKLCEFFFEYKEEIINQYFCDGHDFDENEEFELEDNNSHYEGVNV
jgi:hypothetical protein